MSSSQGQDPRLITRNSKSNLAFAFLGLPKSTRHDLELFYAFCRIVDDLADEPTAPESERMAMLNDWKICLDTPSLASTDFQSAFLNLVERHHLDLQPIREIIAGCQSDLYPETFVTRQDLENYTYRVASCVGITSASIMGASPAAREFAIALGHALQWVNIIRDVDEDMQQKDRVYLPAEDLETFGLSVDDLKSRAKPELLARLLEFEASRALEWFAKAASEWSTLSVSDRKALRPAVAMGEIYYSILRKIREGGYDVYHTRYAISKLAKLWILVSGKHSCLAPR